MTSAKGGTYAGQYLCDGSVDYLEPTLLLRRILCFLIQEHYLKKTVNSISTRQNKRSENRVIYIYIPEFG